MTTDERVFAQTEVRGCVTTRTQIQTSSPIVRPSPDFTLNTAARNVRHQELGTRGDPSLCQGLPMKRESKCDDPLSSSHVGTHEAELHGYQISGIRPEPILTKSAGKSCWSMLTVFLSSAGRRLCTVYPGRHGANSIIAPMNCTWTQCTLHPGGQQTTVYKHATTCWAGLGWAGLGGAAADSGWTLLVPIL